MENSPKKMKLPIMPVTPTQLLKKTSDIIAS